MANTKTYDELRVELVTKAAKDEGFRARLTADPKAAIKEALGVDLPGSLAVHVHEESSRSAHIVLPPSADLTDADLEGVAAGNVQRAGFYQDGEEIRHHHGDGNWH